jgi:HK97 family phage major capsid protein
MTGYINGFEGEVHQDMSRQLGVIANEGSFFAPLDFMVRDITAATASNGGYLVATENQSFADMIRAKSVTARLGATQLSNLKGNVAIPKETGSATAYWLANEATAITESQQTFGQLLLSPKMVGAYTEISRQLEATSSPAAEGVVANDLAKVVATAIDVAALAGTGTSGQPVGIVNTSGIGSATGTSLGLSGLLAAQTAVLSGLDVDPALVGLATTPTVAAALGARQRFTSVDSPLWTGNLGDGSVAGLRAIASNNVPASTAILGYWPDLILATWGYVEIQVNRYANFQAGLVGVRALVGVDIGVRNPASFYKITSVT